MAVRRPLDVTEELLEAFVRSGEVRAYLVSVLPDQVWRAVPPNGRGSGVPDVHRGSG